MRTRHLKLVIFEMSLRLTETYKYMVKSDRMLSEVLTRLKEPYKKTNLINNISTESINNSPIITIIAREKTPELATELANTYATVFQDEIRALMGLDNINILNAVSADADIKEIKSPIIIIVIISFIIGFSIAFMIVLIQEFYFSKLNTVLKVESALNVPNLGNIPDIRKQTLNKKNNVDKWNGKLISNLMPSIILTEEFRRVRANVQFQMEQKNVKAILVTSPVSGDGKSLVSGNLAIIMAMAGKKTIFIDGDLRKPNGGELFNFTERKGLTSFISGHYELKEIIQKTGTKNLSFIGTGPIPPDPTEVLSSDEMKRVIENLKEHYDVIIIDTPPLVVADAVSLSTVVDGCLYVIDAGRTKEEQASKSLEQLKMVGAPILGTILNRSQSGTYTVVYEF